MNVTVLVETATGAQVIPNLEERATISAWMAHLAADADLRTISADYRDIASRLSVVTL